MVGARGLVIADFNGDGRPDIATANHESNTISILLNIATWPNYS
ncbi:FG-GAP repeat protein [Candidatus Midichloria mitochondrii]|nr:FG-GAP repeat protein [Candidatus Midichloria mitochondrii]